MPIYTLKVEQVIYSNLAKLIANQIERTHQIRLGQVNVFAQLAYLPPRPEPLSLRRAAGRSAGDGANPGDRPARGSDLLLAEAARHEDRWRTC